MNCGQFKDPASHLCLAGAVVASWSQTQDGPSLNAFTVMTNIFSENSNDTYYCVYFLGPAICSE